MLHIATAFLFHTSISDCATAEMSQHLKGLKKYPKLTELVDALKEGEREESPETLMSTLCKVAQHEANG